jgi:hypothetical protein
MGHLIADLLGVKTPPYVKEIGFRCREKLHEDLRTEDEGGIRNSANRAEWYETAELKLKLQEALEGVL